MYPSSRFPSGVSLDGASLVLPSGAGAVDLDDDVSSLNSTSVYQGAILSAFQQQQQQQQQQQHIPQQQQQQRQEANDRRPTSIAIANPATPSKLEDIHSIPTPATTTTSNDNNSNDDNKESGGGGVLACYCCPRWLRRSPAWIQLLLALSVIFLLGAIAMVGVGITVGFDALMMGGNNSNNDSSSSNAQSPSFGLVDPPTVAPTAAPIVAPVDVFAPTATPAPVAPEITTPEPSAAPVSDAPTSAEPSQAPTSPAPTARPTPTVSDRRTVLYLTGGGTDSDGDGDGDLPPTSALEQLPVYGHRAQLIHFGNWNNHNINNNILNNPLVCPESVFQDVTDHYESSAVPVYFLKGAAESGDCANPIDAAGFWQDHLGSFNRAWPSPPWIVWRDTQNGFPENVSWGDPTSEVCMVTISLTGEDETIDTIDDDGDRQSHSLGWLEENYFYFRSQGFQTLVILINAGPDDDDEADFYDALLDAIRTTYTDLDFLVVYTPNSASSNNNNFGTLQPFYAGIPHLTLLAVEPAAWPPVRLEVAPLRGDNPVLVDDTGDWWEAWVG